MGWRRQSGIMQDRLRAYATRAVPRYTSYPTAPHFAEDVDGDVYRGWLDALGEDARLSLYLHVPFCREMCRYCGCHTKITRKDAPIADYVATLHREIALVADHVGGRMVDHIHWGGGTPSILKPEQFADLVGLMAERFAFSDGIDHAIELDPRTVTPDMVAMLARAGVTRASLGVQDFNLHVQEAIGRIQPVELVRRVVDLLRDAGITAINLDLMYGLPHQSTADVVRTAEIAADMGATRLALFGYAHVPWFKTHQRLIDAAALPGAVERIDQADAAQAALEAKGYVAIGFDHFALPDDAMAVAQADGNLKRNFQGYTTDTAEALIGFGASSIGSLPQGYVQNAPDVGGWCRLVEAGTLPVVRGAAVSAEDIRRRAIIERLMCDFAVDLAAFMAEDETLDATFGADIDRLSPLIDDGLAERHGTEIRVTEPAKPLVRIVAACFDTYFAASEARHSAAV